MHACMYPQVGAGAQVLAFDAMADVVLSDGTTCTVEAPESHVRTKGARLLRFASVLTCDASLR